MSVETGTDLTTDPDTLIRLAVDNAPPPTNAPQLGEQ
jgi:hypothetical protein